MLRRSFLQGLGALFVAPAIIRAENLMPIKEYALAVPSWCPDGWLPLDGREIKKKFYPDLFAIYEKCGFPMQLGNDQVFSPYSGYEVVETAMRVIPTAYKRIISSKNLYRPNGQQMLAGAICDFYVSGGAA